MKKCFNLKKTTGSECNVYGAMKDFKKVKKNVGKIVLYPTLCIKKKHAKLVFSKVKKVQFVYFLNNLKRLTSELLHFFSIIVGNKV